MTCHKSLKDNGSFTPSGRGSVSVDAQKGFCSFLIGIFTQADADVDAGKWVPDPFKAATLAATLMLTLSVNGLSGDIRFSLN